MMNKRQGMLIAALALNVGVAGCGSKKHSSNPPTFAGQKGTIQGIVLDGLTQKPIKLQDPDLSKNPDGTLGIHVLAHNQLLMAHHTDADNNKRMDKGLDGEYFIRDVPLDEAFPILARIDGYEQFQGHVLIKSIYPRDELGSEHDVKRENPTLIANIMLYPKDTQAKDLKFIVYNNGTPVQDANVQLRPLGQNQLDPAKPAASVASQDTPATARLINEFQGTDFFVRPLNTRLAALSQTTNANGEVLFPGANNLVLGGHYQYTIIPQKGAALVGSGTNSGDIFRTGTVVVGARSNSMSLTSESHVVAIELGTLSPELRVVSTSLTSEASNMDGRIVIVFNRPVKIVPATEDLMKATLSSKKNYQLESDIPNDKRPNSLKYIQNENKTVLTLLPVFSNGAVPKVEVEPGLTVTYSGVFIQPLEGKGTNTPTDLATIMPSVPGSKPDEKKPLPLTVSFFGSKQQ